MEFTITVKTGEGSDGERQYAFVNEVMNADVNDVARVEIVAVRGEWTTFEIETSEESYATIVREITVG